MMPKSDENFMLLEELIDCIIIQKLRDTELIKDFVGAAKQYIDTEKGMEAYTRIKDYYISIFEDYIK